jgi:hypothetical protein
MLPVLYSHECVALFSNSWPPRKFPTRQSALSYNEARRTCSSVIHSTVYTYVPVFLCYRRTRNMLLPLMTRSTITQRRTEMFSVQ